MLEQVQHSDIFIMNQFLTAYCMGSLNKDCWYMYTMKDFSRKMTSEPDQTIEILMSELDPEIMQIFHRENSSTAQEAREVMSVDSIHRTKNRIVQRSGIASLVPNMKIDDYLFHPCGYSMNGVLINVRVSITMLAIAVHMPGE